jgi:acetyltransferase
MKANDFRYLLQLDDGTDVTIRPITPDDAGIEQEFVRSLSTQSKYYRFFTPLRQLSPYALRKFTQNHFPTDMALIATTAVGDRDIEIGVARFAPGNKEGWAEFAIVVADEWQGRGIATHLLQHLFDVAVHAGLIGIEGTVLSENSRMLRLASQLGFSARPDRDNVTLTSISKAF